MDLGSPDACKRLGAMQIAAVVAEDRNSMQTVAKHGALPGRNRAIDFAIRVRHTRYAG
jgi:hypothetical protein